MKNLSKPSSSSVLLLLALTTCSVLINGQELKTVVKGHLDTALKATKEQFGITVKVEGQAGYEISDKVPGGKNLTFVLAGRDLQEGIDPFVKVSFSLKEVNGSIASLGSIGSTESAGLGATSPNWTQPFWFVWTKGAEQALTFRLFDHNQEDKLIEEIDLDLDEYVENGQEEELSLGNGTGTLIVRKTTPVRFKLSAKNIRRADEFNGKSDAYVKVYFRPSLDGQDTKFYTTTTIDNVENADWGDVIVFANYQKGKGQYLHFKLRDADSWTKDDHLGEVLVEADTIFTTKVPQTTYLENSGEHSTLTILPI